VFSVSPCFVSVVQPLAIFSKRRISDDDACWRNIRGSENDQICSYWYSEKCIYKKNACLLTTWVSIGSLKTMETNINSCRTIANRICIWISIDPNIFPVPFVRCYMRSFIFYPFPDCLSWICYCINLLLSYLPFP